MLRRIAFLSLFLFSGFSFYSQAADIALPEIGDSAGALISPQEEFRIGQSFFWRLQQSVDLIDDPEVNKYIMQLGHRLATHSDGASLHFKFFMVPDPRINAFAAPGGFIGINSGLMLTSQEEDELASVLAHEIAHVTQRHILRSIEKQQQGNIPRMAALVGAILLGAADAQAGAAALTVVQASGVQAQIDHTRAHEAEADSLGMQNLVNAGFNAQAMPTFFERLQLSSRFYSSNAVPEFLRTHPVTTSRIAEARGRAVNYPTSFSKRDRLPFFLIREKLRVMSAVNLSELKQYYVSALADGNARNETAVRYGYALALTASGDYSKAKTKIKALITEDPERLSYQLALADIELARGKLTEALSIYRANQRLFPDDYALSVKQAQAFIQARKSKDAANLLLRQVELGHDSALLYKLLAQAHGDMDQRAEAHAWLGEFYYNAGRHEQALDQFELAVKAARGNNYLLARFNSRIKVVESMIELMKAS